MRKNLNTILGIHNSNDDIVSNFKEVTEVGTFHFQYLFKEPLRKNIVEIVNLSSFFPIFVDDEQNGHLLEEAAK
jgi:hypothetical protein